jgi:hypothetical protein
VFYRITRYLQRPPRLQRKHTFTFAKELRQDFLNETYSGHTGSHFRYQTLQEWLEETMTDFQQWLASCFPHVSLVGFCITATQFYAMGGIRNIP